MGRLLAEGGYPGEALTPIHESVELAIRAMAVLVGQDENGGDPVPAAVIHGHVVGKGLLATTDAAQVSVLREIAATGGVDEATARSLVASGQSIVEKAGAALVRKSL